jgi:NADH-quinone oxidoreductase subunit M
MTIILPILILTPLIGGILLLMFAQRAEDSFRNFGVAAGGMTLLFSVMLAVWISGQQPAPDSVGSVVPSIEYKAEWLSIAPPYGDESGNRWYFVLGCDGIGNLMVLLTTIVTLAVLIFSTLTVKTKNINYAGWLLLAEAGLLSVFLAMDVVTFYIGFELTLIPLFVLIAGWGNSSALMAGRRFVLFTLAGSIPMIVAIIGLVAFYSNESGATISIPELSVRAFDSAKSGLMAQQGWIFWMMVFGLGIKTAVLPLHSWLPTTYSASHPTTTALMAGVVLKLGLFGFIRIVIPLLPGASVTFGPYVLGTLGAIAITYGALNALAQTDLRLLLAYSSLSHVGFITLGLFSLNQEGLGGAALQMFNHGITTAAMFLLIDSLIMRRGTHCLTTGSHGLGSVFPRLSLFFFFFVAAGAGVPGLNNFVGEVLTLSGMVLRHPVLAVAGTLGVVLGAWYAFRLLQKLFMGPYERSKIHGESVAYDVGMRETAVFSALAIICIFIGVLPQRVLDTIRPDARRIAIVCFTAMKSLPETADIEKLSSVSLSDIELP